MYAMVCSQPDIAQAVSMVSRYMANPGKQHWDAIKWHLRYLKGTSDVCLKFGIDDIGLIGNCDSDFAGDLDGRKSTWGMVFTLGGTVISWMFLYKRLRLYRLRKRNISQWKEII